VRTTHTLALVVALLLGALCRDLLASRAQAEAEPPFDRALAERLVRVEEQQQRALEGIKSAIEHCQK
jgi:hypothetical protein